VALSEVHPQRYEPTRAVDRALALLVEVGGIEAGAGLSDLARATGVPTSTALRLLRTLQAADFIRRDEAGRYLPGPALLALSARAMRSLPLVQVVEPRLDMLVEETGESANLAVLDGDGLAVYVAQARSPHSIHYSTNWRGRGIPADVSAIGSALHGRVDENGYVARSDVVEPDVTAVAAPVRGPGGDIVAAISVTGPTYRMPKEALGEMGEAVARHAREASAELGAPGT
jgi:IclR family transcriptional regulator, acetate operon repressor